MPRTRRRAFWISQKGAIERERSPQPPEQRMMSSAVRGAAGVDMNLATAARQAGVPAECPYLREKGCMAGRGGGGAEGATKSQRVSAWGPRGGREPGRVVGRWGVGGVVPCQLARCAREAKPMHRNEVASRSLLTRCFSWHEPREPPTCRPHQGQDGAPTDA